MCFLRIYFIGKKYICMYKCLFVFDFFWRIFFNLEVNILFVKSRFFYYLYVIICMCIVMWVYFFIKRDWNSFILIKFELYYFVFYIVYYWTVCVVLGESRVNGNGSIFVFFLLGIFKKLGLRSFSFYLVIIEK